MLSKLLSKHKSMIDECIDLENKVLNVINIVARRYYGLYIFKSKTIDDMWDIDWNLMILTPEPVHKLNQKLVKSAMVDYFNDNADSLVRVGETDDFSESDIEKVKSLSGRFISWFSDRLIYRGYITYDELKSELSELGLLGD